MKRFGLTTLLIIAITSPTFAVSSLQLFISGATYDWNTQTWTIESTGFDLYVVSANSIKNDVIVSMAMGPSDQPADLDVTFGSRSIGDSDWRFGFAPLDNDPNSWDGGSQDLSRHGIYPTWFTEIRTGSYGLSSTVGDVQPNSYGQYWNPATRDGNAPARGDIKMFHVEASGVFSYLHFDAYTLDSRGRIAQAAPFSHDAEASPPGEVPEPGTLALMGTGLVGILAALKRRKF